MRVPIDERFLDELKAFALRHGCDHCLHFLADQTCAHEWPNREHRALPVDARVDSPEGRAMVFCKEFELL